MNVLTPTHVQKMLNTLGLEIDILFFEQSTATSQMAADNIGCELGQIAKSIAFILDGKPILVVTSGDQRVDDKKLAQMFEVGRKKVKVAKPEQCIEIYGYAPGGVPPIAHRTDGITIYLDETLKRYETLYAAGGAHNAIFPITVEQLQQATSGTFADVVIEKTPDEA